jgi:hypothetical protein
MMKKLQELTLSASLAQRVKPTRTFTTSSLITSTEAVVHPYFITGLTDGEGCFLITVLKNQKLKTGWEVQLIFQINLHKKDHTLLKLIQSSFYGVGSITKHGKDSIKYRVASAQDLAVIINHFDKYPLITQKNNDYLLFKEAFDLVKSKKHLTIEGLHKIVAIKASMNRGLSDELKADGCFAPNIIPVERPSVKGKKKLKTRTG